MAFQDSGVLQTEDSEIIPHREIPEPQEIITASRITAEDTILLRNRDTIISSHETTISQAIIITAETETTMAVSDLPIQETQEIPVVSDPVEAAAEVQIPAADPEGAVSEDKNLMDILKT